jgi:hypothetical protein
MKTIKRLIRTAAPDPRESILGYIIRLAELNYYDTSSWIFQVAGITKYTDTDFSIINNRSNLTPLSRLTGINPDQLESLYLPRIGKSVAPDSC